MDVEMEWVMAKKEALVLVHLPLHPERDLLELVSWILTPTLSVSMTQTS